MRITIQKGLISLPNDPKTPVICVGPGTGIAPMRAVIEDRIHTGCESESLRNTWWTTSHFLQSRDSTLAAGQPRRITIMV